jgi:hypothetical protein
VKKNMTGTFWNILAKTILSTKMMGQPCKEDAGKKCEAEHCVKIAGKVCKLRQDDFNVGQLLSGREMI